MTEHLVEGWTEPIDQQLFTGPLGAEVPMNLSGMTVALLLYDKRGAAVSLGGTASITDAATGKVRYSPAAGELLNANSPYYARWKVTASGKDALFPNAEADKWYVRKP